VNSKVDLVLVTLAVLPRQLACWLHLPDRPADAGAVGVLIGGLAVALVVAWFSQPGKRFIAYGRESYEETRRVVCRAARRR